ncbi:MAG: 4Fe-4S binding protein [Candidatus Delongbacteria bacterium]|nr:4Fe-4S binding protein [Candidatus Delongbacteria bacterium]
MAVKITDECINCAACETECPSAAIFEGDDIFEVDPDKCTECEGLDEQQCMAVCPADCIIFDR